MYYIHGNQLYVLVKQAEKWQWHCHLYFDGGKNVVQQTKLIFITLDVNFLADVITAAAERS